MLDSDEAIGSLAEPSASLGHRRILLTAALFSAATILVKLVAFAKDLLVADRLGAADELEAYLLALVVPWFAVVVLAQAFGSALLPTYVQVAQRQGAATARRLAGGSLAGAIVILTLIALVLSAVAPLVFPWLAIGFDSDKMRLTLALFYLMVAVVLFGGASAVLGALLNAEDRFAATALAPLAVPLCTIGVFWWYQDRLGVHALAAGTLLGFAVECVILAVAVARRRLVEWPRTAALDANLSIVVAHLWPLTAGAVLMSGSTVVDQAMAASLGSGNVSVLTYGNKVVALALSIVALSLSRALFPRFARLVADGQWPQLRATLDRYALVVLVASIPCVVLLAVASEPIVRLLFERGAFTAEVTTAVSRVQVYLALQIPFFVLNMIGLRALSALGANAAVLRISALSLVVNIIGDYVLMQWLGVDGIALSTSLVYLLAAAVTWWATRARLHRLTAST
jgi:putative peptidoglycan lipid II flippase